MAQRYLLNEELLKKLSRIEEVAENLRQAIEENNEAHRKFYNEFTELLHKEDTEIVELQKKFAMLSTKYLAAKKLFDSE